MYKQLLFDKARNALKHIVLSYNIKKMHIPYYLCDVIRHSLFEVNCKPIFYHIDDNFMPDKDFNTDEYVLYPNYFGVYGKNAESLAKCYPKLIVDNAHAYFDEPLGFACFNAGHKFGFKNSILWIEKSHESKNYSEKHKTKKLLYNQNFLKLCDKYNNSNSLLIETRNDIYPFVYPYLAKTEKDANELVKKLDSQGICIFRYWNFLPKTFNEYKFYSRLVPIPVINS